MGRKLKAFGVVLGKPFRPGDFFSGLLKEENCMQLTRLVYASHHGGTSEEALRDIFDRS